MSETFKQLQENLRFYKEGHQIDLTVPHGVSIGGKVYPAVTKMMDMSMKGHNQPEHARFEIPFESGNRAHIFVEKGSSGITAFFNIPSLHVYPDREPHYSHIWHNIMEPYEEQINDTKYKVSVAPLGSDKQMNKFHKTMKEWSTEPRRGFVFTHKTNRDTVGELKDNLRQMSPQELDEHKKNYKEFENYAPHNIRVYEMGREKGYKHHYNVLTEQLKKSN